MTDYITTYKNIRENELQLLENEWKNKIQYITNILNKLKQIKYDINHYLIIRDNLLNLDFINDDTDLYDMFKNIKKYISNEEYYILITHISISCYRTLKKSIIDSLNITNNRKQIFDLLLI